MLLKHFAVVNEFESARAAYVLGCYAFMDDQAMCRVGSFVGSPFVSLWNAIASRILMAPVITNAIGKPYRRMTVPMRAELSIIPK